MKISNKTGYGLRFMLNLAVSYGQAHQTLSDIAEREQISEKFLESIAAIIKSKGLVKVKRGAKGGYELSRPPAQITMKEIFETLEGDFFKSDFGYINSDASTVNQTVNSMLVNFSLDMKAHLESLTLETLLNDYNTRSKNQMFCI